jgi:hypothetical protein
MGYVIAAILVVLLVAGLIMLIMRNATKKSNVSDAGDPGADQNPMGIVGSDDETPVGDTNQVAGDRNEGGRTGATTDSPDVARPVVGGEAEGERSSR